MECIIEGMEEQSAAPSLHFWSFLWFCSTKLRNHEIFFGQKNHEIIKRYIIKKCGLEEMDLQKQRGLFLNRHNFGFMTID